MSPDIVYSLPDKLGGVFSFCANLLAHRRRGGLPYGAVLTHNVWSTDVRSGEALPVEWQRSVEERLPLENLYAALRRVRKAIDGRGALVCNDWIELAAASAFPIDRTVFSIVHGDMDYYYDLAVRHEHEIDAYVTYAQTIYDRLVERLPHRRDTIFLRKYGVPILAPREATPGPLRLLYVGRIDRHKGVFDLPAIAAAVREQGADVTWTVQGTGPDEAALRRVWTDPSVRWTGRQPMAQVFAEYQRHDVLVMPSRFEGLPVALLEAGSAGVVPVASDLASGIPEIVRNGDTGWRAPVGDAAAFARAIVALARDRDRLAQMSAGIRTLVINDWDIRVRAAEYETLFDRWAELRRPRTRRRAVPYGSRLDKRWLPNAMVRAVRTLRRGAMVRRSSETRVHG